MKQFRRFLVIGGSLLGFAACSSNEIGNSKDVAPETVYQQYRIDYYESSDKLDLHAQFRFGGFNGTTLVLNNPSSISLDGQTLKVDSSKYGGAFYESHKSASQFGGTHRYVFTDINGKKYENSFVFEPLRLVQAPTSASRKQALQLVFNSDALQDGDEIQVSTSGSDSAYSFTHDVSPRNYTVEIPASELARQKKDRLLLDIILMRNSRLQQQTKEGGEMNMRQQLKPLQIKLNN